MLPMPIADHIAITKELAYSGKYVKVLWQSADTLMFIARGREYRSEFHINPSDEHMTMLKGSMNLHYRTPEGKEAIAVLNEGETIYTAAGIPHSPRFSSDAFLLVGERMRKAGETDTFQWFCGTCDAQIHQEFFVVNDYTKDPVSRAYDNFFNSMAARTCEHCGSLHPGRDFS
ncbi:MAG: 3-hydroxyanthranilate 3,4-dioxygenase [Alphaproteobacteria bacterium MarineAlpha11_Bin1]|nr:MAG: 3-hydroxyanthranilate 3,4-dioxygenase [Alphaproteobacteria bacterium MarineAlpha11_Bin1]|tara:strand:- start:4226 stop:4744 length:519 start_codon:yes stop_codon:yes gene_type:complete